MQQYFKQLQNLLLSFQEMHPNKRIIMTPTHRPRFPDIANRQVYLPVSPEQKKKALENLLESQIFHKNNVIIGASLRRWGRKYQVKLSQIFKAINNIDCQDFHVCVRTIRKFQLICQIQFQNLKQLDLYQCCIESIQALPHLQSVSKLQTLKLSRNNITNIKPLIRLQAPLKILQLDKNLITDLSPLSICPFIGTLVALGIEDYPQTDVQDQQITHLAKIINAPQQTNQKQMNITAQGKKEQQLIIYIRSVNRIRRNCVIDKFLGRKWLKIKGIQSQEQGNNFRCKDVIIYDKNNMGGLVSDDDSSPSSSEPELQ